MDEHGIVDALCQAGGSEVREVFDLQAEPLIRT